MKKNFTRFGRFALVIVFLSTLLTNAFSQTIVYPSNGSAKEVLAAKEVRRYTYLRTNQNLTIQKATALPSGELILVAKKDDPLLNGLSLGYSPKVGEFVIKTINSGGRNILVICGGDADATLVAAYRYAEKLGCSFDLAGDIIPDAKISLSITGYDEVGIPNFETRGIQPFHDFFQGPDVWSTNDYKAIISQLPKLGMNFIGLKTYPKHSLQEEVAKHVNEGPEATVWVGLPEDVNSDGTVKWSYPAFYCHTKRPHRIWGTATLSTDQFHAGAQDLFDRNGWGSEVMGDNMPYMNADNDLALTDFDYTGFNTIFNKNGQMFKEAFAHAKNIGVKTCVGTELPMGLEPAGGEEVKTDWVRGMPTELQLHLQSLGKDPKDPAIVKEIYKGIFTRIMKTHDLDYYWLWTYEVWQNDGSMTAAQITAIKNDIEIAKQALAEVGNPFKLAMAGWKLGSFPNTYEFDNPSASPFLPYDVPFMSLWDLAEGHDELSPSRKKWPATWYEEDWGLGQPQLGLPRIYNDAKASVGFNCDGFLAKHWRTKIVSPNTGAMKDMIWNYGTTSAPPTKGVPGTMSTWVDSYWAQWANEQFGTEVGSQYASIMAAMDKAGEPGKANAIPAINDWQTEKVGTNSAPAAIGWGEQTPQPWSTYQSGFSFVSTLESLESSVVGAGNKERYKYYLNTFKSMKKKGEYLCKRTEFETAMAASDFTAALTHRRAMARLFEQIMTLEIEKIASVSDMGEIASLEILDWYQLVQLKYDAAMSAGLGGSIPADANPSTNYSGAQFIKVVPVETQVAVNTPLTLDVIAFVTGTPVLKYREIGSTTWMSKSLSQVARKVYSVTIPAQVNDFEYYIESGSTVFPVTANAASPIYQTVVVAGDPVIGTQYTLTTSATNGSVSPANGSFNEGSVVSLTATPDVGYVFSSWSGDVSGTENPVSLTMNSNKSVIANFVPAPDYSVIITPDANGSIALNPAGGTYPSGTQVTVTATPNSGYYFNGWTGDLTGSTNPTTIIVDGNKTIGATYVQTPTYTLSTSVTNGSITLNPAGGSYSSGTVVTVTANPNSGYQFDSWGGNLSGNTNPTTITMDDNKSITANISQIPTGTWNKIDDRNGSITYSGDWENQSEGNAYSGTIKIAEGSVSATYTFTGTQFRVYVYRWDAAQAGTITISNSTVSNQTFSLGSGNEGQFMVYESPVLPSGNHTVTITRSSGEFLLDALEYFGGGSNPTTYTLTTSASGNGTVSPSGLNTHNSGAIVSVTATPQSGYQFDGWSGAATGTTNPVSITMDANKTLTANFSQIPPVYSLTTSVVGNGSVNPSGTTNHNSGTLVSVTATPQSGYQFDGWSGAATGSANPVSITMDGNKMLTATFSAIPTYTLATNVSNGSISLNPAGGSYLSGTVVTLTATPNSGYQFDNWSGDLSGTTNPTSITMNGNKSVNANISIIPSGLWNKIDDRDAGISYSGDWDNEAEGAAYSGTIKIANGSASASYTFTGTQFRIYVYRWDAAQAGTITISNSSVNNQAFSLSSGDEGSFMVYESPVLPSGSHTVTITRSSGEFLLDALEYFGVANKSNEYLDANFDSAKPEVFIYPNPVADYVVNIKFQGVEEEVELKLIDLSGKVIISKNIDIRDNELINLSLEGISKGVYILSVQSEGVNKNERLIVE